MKVCIKIKTRDKIKCSQKISWEGGNFHEEKCLPGKLPSKNLPPIPQRKKIKLTPENIISKVKCKRKRRDDKKIG